MQDRKVWNADERELIALRARQLRRHNPDIVFAKLFEMSQDVLAPNRRRKWLNKPFDLWILDASFTPSASELANALAEKFAAAATSGDSVLKALGTFLGVGGEGEGGEPASEPPREPTDGRKQEARRNIGQGRATTSYRQTSPRSPFRDLYESLSNGSIP